MKTQVDVAIVGAGQAGLSLGACLARTNIDYMILERTAVGSAWRNRWDSFCLVTPSWSVRLAHQDYNGDDPDGFMNRDEVVRYLESYATTHQLNVSTGQEVVDAHRTHGAWRLRTAEETTVTARILVVATATHQRPRLPTLSEQIDLPQLHTAEYRQPDDVPSGTVLVVGSGQSGAQIAWELHRAGRKVILATSRVGRVPRRYRGRDVIEWQRDLGFLDRHVNELTDIRQRFRPDPLLSGQNGGQDINLRKFAADGIQLAGRLKSVRGDCAEFEDNVEAHLQYADAVAADFYRQVAASLGQAPPNIESDTHIPKTIERIRLGGDGVASILWATGYARDFGWIKLDRGTDTHTKSPLGAQSSTLLWDTHLVPRQIDFETPISGLHFLGFNYLDYRRSGILYGAGVESTRLALRISEDLGNANKSGSRKASPRTTTR